MASHEVVQKEKWGHQILHKNFNSSFDLIHKTHIGLEHKGCDIKEHKLKIKYVILLRMKSKCTWKRVDDVTKVGQEFNSRGRVDLINYQESPSYHYKSIMVYKEHLTKSCSYKCSLQKRAEEVAHDLVDHFAMLGVPIGQWKGGSS